MSDILVHLDRLEGEMAVLVVSPSGTERISLPSRLLPPGAREGDAFTLRLQPCPEDGARARTAELMDSLFGQQAD